MGPLPRPSAAGVFGRAEPSDRRPAALGQADAHRADRRDAEGRHLPSDADRSRPPGARLVQGAMRGARLHRAVDDVGTMFARRPGKNPHPADRHGLASRHPADRRQVRRRARRSRRARSHAHAPRNRLRDQRADRDRQLDQRRGRAFAPAMLASGVFAGVFSPAYAYSRADRDGKTFGDELAASATGAPRKPARASFRRCSNCTSSRVRSSKPKAV